MPITEAYTLYAEPIRRYIAKMVLSSELADDLVQDTFIRAWRAWDSIRVSVQAWLYKIARNIVASYQRRLTVVEAPLEDAGDTEDVVDAIGAIDEREHIEKTLSVLAPTYANALRICLDGGNLPQKMLAARSGVSVQNFKAHVSRGRKQFALRYAEQQKGA